MNKFLFILVGAVLGVFGFMYLIHGFHNMHISAVFDELEPLPKNINVYYKGFRLGRAVRVHPSNDFTKTYVEIVLNAKNLSLPDNITAKVRKKNKRDYIEIEYPDAPSVTYLRNHSVIQGKRGFGISDYIDDQADEGGIDEIKENLNVTVQSAGETFEALTDLFGTANDILKDLQPSLKQTGDNLVIMSQNLAEVSAELNRSVRPNRLENIFANLENTTRNFQDTTLNINNLTQNANRETITLTNCLLRNANAVVSNINDIVKGFKETLSKRFGTMKLMFGKPIEGGTQACN